MGIWLRQLSNPVKQAIANMELEGGQLEETLRVADAVHRSVATSGGIQPIAAITTTASSLDETTPALDPVAV